jgi:hypothetical protein
MTTSSLIAGFTSELNKLKLDYQRLNSIVYNLQSRVDENVSDTSTAVAVVGDDASYLTLKTYTPTGSIDDPPMEPTKKETVLWATDDPSATLRVRTGYDTVDAFSKDVIIGYNALYIDPAYSPTSNAFTQNGSNKKAMAIDCYMHTVAGFSSARLKVSGNPTEFFGGVTVLGPGFAESLYDTGYEQISAGSGEFAITLNKVTGSPDWKVFWTRIYDMLYIEMQGQGGTVTGSQVATITLTLRASRDQLSNWQFSNGGGSSYRKITSSFYRDGDNLEVPFACRVGSSTTLVAEMFTAVSGNSNFTTHENALYLSYAVRLAPV